MASLLQELEKKILNRKGTGTSWSPNAMKSLVISEDFLLCVLHTGEVVIEGLNPAESSKSLTRGNLNRLLANSRVLGNLEEFYVSQNIYNNKRFFDVGQYVNSLARLRFFGVCLWRYDNLNEVSRRLKPALRDKAEDFLLCEFDKIGFRAVAVNNEDWFMKIALYPYYYKLDDANGKLAKVLNAVKDKYSGGVEVEEKKNTATPAEKDLVKKNLDRIKEILTLTQANKFCNSGLRQCFSEMTKLCPIPKGCEGMFEEVGVLSNQAKVEEKVNYETGDIWVKGIDLFILIYTLKLDKSVQRLIIEKVGVPTFEMTLNRFKEGKIRTREEVLDLNLPRKQYLLELIYSLTK